MIKFCAYFITSSTISQHQDALCHEYPPSLPLQSLHQQYSMLAALPYDRFSVDNERPQHRAWNRSKHLRHQGKVIPSSPLRRLYLAHSQPTPSHRLIYGSSATHAARLAGPIFLSVCLPVGFFRTTQKRANPFAVCATIPAYIPPRLNGWPTVP